MQQVPYGSVDRDKPLIRVPFTRLAVITVCLPLLGLVACIVLALLYHYNDATYTHCEVPNYLPSISAAISLTPERYIWRFSIGLHSAPRFLVAAAYLSFYRGRFSRRLTEQLLSALTFLLALSENVGLLLLTYVSSNETYSVHKSGFILFIDSLFHMMCTCKLWSLIAKYSLSAEEMKSYRRKLRLFLFNGFFGLLAAYFYKRHNAYCEAGSSEAPPWSAEEEKNEELKAQCMLGPLFPEGTASQFPHYKEVKPTSCQATTPSLLI
ncbi:post-GPI attachment to proteins factor 2-like isoform X2 [Sinocyclocheilus rhinocerous]|uniref:post-GPI attachment to proteins factor 2-like isoform X2 n=1 Tax=Sinocyclocheilus rhinocerous TaxID=307959 RepID=UPI0007B7F776|nr:PREDICTED: post-GPI attachment to proteins factor 2-like isoform X2 [Sinocyclocheilus rhinocerous]